MSIVFEAIGIISTPFLSRKGMPIQPAGAKGVRGKVILNENLVEGIQDLDGFSHLILIYYLHLSEGFDLQTKPFLDNEVRGVFATRAPRRPNAIGLSVVKLKKIERNILDIENVDILDGTPLLDIKPYVPGFDAIENIETGWLDEKMIEARKKKSDDRYV